MKLILGKIDCNEDGNQLEIRERITDPAEPQGFREVPLKKHLWDEEDRLRAVDLSPENDEDKPLVAVYTYDASGERSIKYVPGRLDARYSAKEIGKSDRLESMLYPNPLLTAKTLPIPEMRRDVKDPKLISFGCKAIKKHPTHFKTTLG